MSVRPNAVELTVEQSWYIAETVGAGAFPWVLAITTPYRDAVERGAFLDGQAAELAQLGLVSSDGVVNPAVVDWIKLVCFPERWLDLRFIGAGSSADELLRGIVARRDQQTVVALRNAQLVTFTAMDINDPRELVPVLTAGLGGKPPAHFEEFRLPTRVGARADERLRAGAELPEVLDYLGIPRSSRPVVESVFTGPRSYVEIVAGQRDDGQHATTDVGMSIVDTGSGRVLVSPSRAFDGEWVSTFSPGTPLAVATAVEQLTALLPAGQWFPEVRLSRDFTAQSI